MDLDLSEILARKTRGVTDLDRRDKIVISVLKEDIKDFAGGLRNLASEITSMGVGAVDNLQDIEFGMDEVVSELQGYIRLARELGKAASKYR